MGKMVVVKGDAVQGKKDMHIVSGMTLPPPPTVTYSGSGTFPYNGAITDGLSTFVTIGGQPVALKTSQSSLNPGELKSGGGHDPTMGIPPYAPPNANPVTLTFLPPVIGVGVPNAASGSALLTVGGVKVLLDGDKIDTCDGTGSANSTVTASGQSFLSCSG